MKLPVVLQPHGKMLTVVVPLAPPPPTRAKAGDDPPTCVSSRRPPPIGDCVMPAFGDDRVSVPWFAARVRLAIVTVVGAAVPGVSVTVPPPTRLTVPRAWFATALGLPVNVIPPARLIGVAAETRW